MSKAIVNSDGKVLLRNGKVATTDSKGCCCNPTGACCDGVNCSVGAEADCGGVYQGDGTVCDPTPCSGACCFGNDCSLFDTEENCSAAGGVWTDTGVPCDPNPCSCGSDHFLDCFSSISISFTGYGHKYETISGGDHDGETCHFDWEASGSASFTRFDTSEIEGPGHVSPRGDCLEPFPCPLADQREGPGHTAPFNPVGEFILLQCCIDGTPTYKLFGPGCDAADFIIPVTFSSYTGSVRVPDPDQDVPLKMCEDVGDAPDDAGTHAVFVVGGAPYGDDTETLILGALFSDSHGGFVFGTSDMVVLDTDFPSYLCSYPGSYNFTQDIGTPDDLSEDTFGSHVEFTISIS